MTARSSEEAPRGPAEARDEPVKWRVCGCKTSEQTGTLNGYMCEWHREKYLAALASERAAGRVEGLEEAARIADRIGRLYGERDESPTPLPTEATCGAIACAVNIAAEVRAAEAAKGGREG
jgi:hypothetical protein